MGTNTVNYKNPMYEYEASDQPVDENGPPSFELYHYLLWRAGNGHYNPRLDELDIILGLRRRD